RKAKRELIRIVRTTDGNVTVDFGGKLNGRGAYICPKTECLKKAQKSNSLARSLETEIPDEVYQRLSREIEVAQNG
ncbi:MAG: YlxR family protein, partial [Oscillospiraceae bacterium]|nr:YlxR family protein [Oscillospiraceae bacterium]